MAVFSQAELDLPFQITVYERSWLGGNWRTSWPFGPPQSSDDQIFSVLFRMRSSCMSAPTSRVQVRLETFLTSSVM
ncbi:hypothetical protein ACFQY4_01605 [Catellatospora bangladeshensis]|uniref:hypothetical protein n=1 Tax=Catellatospora bangladeshensis TaxID=310355 RepID=UPI00360B07C4